MRASGRHGREHQGSSNQPEANSIQEAGQRRLRVFLCHASKDKKPVRDLYRQLRADGIDPWLDEEDLLPGQKWQEEIPNAIRDADVVLICLSKQSTNREGYVQEEIRFALDIAETQQSATISLIPVRLEECSPPERLKGYHWVDLFDNGYDRLIRSMQVRARELGILEPRVRLLSHRSDVREETIWRRALSVRNLLFTMAAIVIITTAMEIPRSNGDWGELFRRGTPILELFTLTENTQSARVTPLASTQVVRVTLTETPITTPGLTVTLTTSPAPPPDGQPNLLTITPVSTSIIADLAPPTRDDVSRGYRSAPLASSPVQANTDLIANTVPITLALQVQDQESDGFSIIVDEVLVPRGSWVIVHEELGGVVGQVIGWTYVTRGTSTDVRVQINGQLTTGDTVRVLLYEDIDRDEAFSRLNPDVPYPPLTYGVARIRVTVPPPTPTSTHTPTAKATPTPSIPAGSLSLKVHDQESDGFTIVVEEVTVPRGSWVVVHEELGGAIGQVIGWTYVMRGESRAVTVKLSGQLMDGLTMRVLLYEDVDGDEAFSRLRPDVPYPPLAYDVARIRVTIPPTPTPTSTLLPSPTSTETATATVTPTFTGTPTLFPTSTAIPITSALHIRALDQVSNGRYVIIDEVVAAQDGWLRLYYTDAIGGTTPQVAGSAPVKTGVNVKVEVTFTELADVISNGAEIVAILHANDEPMEIFDFPDADLPVIVNGEIVSASFRLYTEPLEIMVADQDLKSRTVTVAEVSAVGANWVVIYHIMSSSDKRIIGQTHLDSGRHTNVVVPINLDGIPAGSRRFQVVLHQDTGVQGVFDFPIADPVIVLDESPVTYPFIGDVPDVPPTPPTTVPTP